MNQRGAMCHPGVHPAVQAALERIPTPLLKRSGSIFYTGRAAFSGPSTIYILGLNPGGDPSAQNATTIEANRERFFEGPTQWSAYADESWQAAPPGTWGMQPRVIHLLNGLGVDPRTVPASNVVFVRSETEQKLHAEKDELLRACWPVHQAVVDGLCVRVIICFGGTAGRWVRDKLCAQELVGEYQEDNHRRWVSLAHRSADDRIVITLTHPGRANWCNPQSDPTPMVRRLFAEHTSQPCFGKRSMGCLGP